MLGRQDSNLRMAEPKSAALPLGDAPIFSADTLNAYPAPRMATTQDAVHT